MQTINIKYDNLNQALLGLTNQLGAITSELYELTEKLALSQMKYDTRFARVLIDAPYSNQSARDAHARLVCDEEGLIEPLENYKFQARRLLTERETLIAMSANLRSLLVGYNQNETKNNS